MKAAIIGTRHIDYGYRDWEQMLMNVIDISTIDMVISGGARGTDDFAQMFAKLHGLSIMIYYPDYKRYGKTAPLIRNTQIAEAADINLSGCYRPRRGRLIC